MKKTSIILSCIALSVGAMHAEVLTPEQALERAMGDTPNAAKSAVGTKNRPQLVFTASCENEPGAYVFANSTAGYVVLSADDAAPAVLGYSDTGTFDPDNAPAALLYWLDMYAQEIQNARSTGATAVAKSVASVTANFTSISPLCQTLWDQGSPYYNLCPTSGERHAYTGCVATAMAQKMKYHEYPAVGTGTLTNTSLESITIDLADYPFDWDNMLDTYDSSATDAQKTAVAELMLCCGMAVNMSYSTSESGATANSVPGALVDNFHYGKGTHLLCRDFIKQDEWMTTVYNEIKNVGPVVYAGNTANSEGHCWIVDGYSSDGYFHINWGWSGVSDGYYLLTALDPLSQGIGGAASASPFNYSQYIVVDAKPNADAGEYYYSVICSNGFGVSKSRAALGTYISLTGGYYNYSNTAVSGTLGLYVTDSNGDKRYLRGYNISDLQSWTGYSSYTCLLPYDLEDGTYTISPAWVNSDYTYRDILVPLNLTSKYKMEIVKGVAYFTEIENGATIAITDLECLVETPYIGQTLNFSMTVTNDTEEEYFADVAAGLWSEDTMEYWNTASPEYSGGEVFFNIGAGESIEYTYSTSFTGMDAGNYILAMYDVASGERLSEPIYITLSSMSITKFTVSDLAIPNATTVNGTLVADPENLKFQFDVTCTQGLFLGEVYVGIQQESEAFFRAYIESETLEIMQGETKTVTVSGYISATSGKTYSAYVYDGPSISDNKLAGPVTFVCDISNASNNSSGISDLSTDESAISVVYYNMQGMKIQNPTTGTPCVKVSKYVDGTVKYTKIVK